MRVTHILRLFGDCVGFVPLFNLYLPYLIALFLHRPFILQLSPFLLLILNYLIMELLLLANQRVDLFGEAFLDQIRLHVLSTGEHRVRLQQSERVHARIGDSGAQISRSDMRAFEFFKLGIFQPLECIGGLSGLHPFVENAVSEGLLANTFSEGYRCQSETLLLGTVENMLVQSLLLLRNQLFLECHLGVQVMRVPQRLIQEVVHRVYFQLLILTNQVFLTLTLLQFQPLGDSLQVLADVATQDLLFGFDAIVAD